MYRDT